MIALSGNLAASKLVLENLANEIEGREATLDERNDLTEFLGDRLNFVRDMLAGKELKRPQWTTGAVD
ncbi:hypothetical protein ASE59_12095 [Sphingomonas sp. Leaf10]|nr:hypothetical protein ASE59_12095 [Sphingomonas sp. Leaf10]